MFAYKQAQASTATPAISTFGAALAGHTVQAFRGKEGKRQVIRLNSKTNPGQIVDVVLSEELSKQFKGGLIGLTEMNNCEIHERQAVDTETGNMETYYLLQRPATAAVSLDGDKLASASKDYTPRVVNLKGIKVEDFVA